MTKQQDAFFQDRLFMPILVLICLIAAELQAANTGLTEKNRDLEAAMKEIKTLSGLLPICMHCKKIRDDKGYWQQMETYIHPHSDAQFSHSICRECADKYYPELDLYDDEED